MRDMLGVYNRHLRVTVTTGPIFCTAWFIMVWEDRQIGEGEKERGRRIR